MILNYRKIIFLLQQHNFLSIWRSRYTHTYLCFTSDLDKATLSYVPHQFSLLISHFCPWTSCFPSCPDLGAHYMLWLLTLHYCSLCLHHYSENIFLSNYFLYLAIPSEPIFLFSSPGLL